MSCPIKKTPLGRSLFVTLLAATMWLVQVEVQAQAQATPEPTSLNTAREAVAAADAALRRITAKVKEACDAADAADDELLKEGRTPSPLTQSLAQAATSKRQLCEQWQDTRVQQQSLFDAARSALRRVAAEPAAVAPVSVGARPDPSPSGGIVIPTAEELQSVVVNAQEAQEKVDKARAALVGIYDVVDSATKAALALKLKTDGSLVATSNGFQDLAREARDARSDAQTAANAFLKEALVIKACLLTESKTCGSAHALAYGRAVAEQSKMNVALALSKDKLTRLKNSAAEVEVAGIYTDPIRRIDALRFAKLLETYPEAGAPFVKDGTSLVVSSKETSASIKLGLNRLFASGWREASVLFSAPLTGSRPSNVFNYADGLIGLPKLGLSYAMLDAKPVSDKGNWLVSFTTGLRVGYETRNYYAAGPAFPQAESSVRLSPWSLSGAVVWHDVGTRRAHLVRTSWQRVYKDGPVKNRCPVDRTGDVLFVDCITGNFGAPKARDEAVLAYQYRYRNDGETFAASPTLTYNTRTKVTEFGLPIFLWHGEEEKKTTFNTGIRIDWVGKGKPAISGNTKDKWSFGIFVGAPFSLLSRTE